MRRPEEDLTAQLEEEAAARAHLTEVLEDLAAAAASAARVAGSRARRPPPVPLDEVRSQVLRLDRAEQRLDLARYDVHTASGGDG